MNTVSLPRYTIGQDAFEGIANFKGLLGSRVVLLYGEKAYLASQEKILTALAKYQIEVVFSMCYGKDATYENVELITKQMKDVQCDFIMAIGGGKCIDTCKVVGDKLAIPLVSVPTIASTCAAVTKISVMYNDDGSFKDIYRCKDIPFFTLIDSQIISKAPIQYIWAGIGDTVAKNVETEFSCRNDQLTYQDQLALNVAIMCYDSILAHGEKCYNDIKNGVISEDVEITIQNILVSTGIVSILINGDYNSALAHALFYGFTTRKIIEEKHLHGEVVAYGVLVQLAMDQQDTKLAQTIDFYKKMALPTKLSDIDIDVNDDLSDIIELTLVNKELDHIPYEITYDMILNTMKYLEQK